MNNITAGALALVAAVGIGYSFGRYVQPGKVVIQTKEVIKTVEVVKHDMVTTTKETKHPDGTVETDTTVVDKDISTTNSSDTIKASETIVNVKPQWKATGLAGYNFSNFEKVYGAEIDRRILGPIFVGAWGNTDHTAGLSVSIEF